MKKKPLNFAILKYFTTVEEACAEDVIEALKGEYGDFKALKKNAVIEALMTGEKNGLLRQSRYEMGDDDHVRLYYQAHEEGAATINNYIPD